MKFKSLRYFKNLFTKKDSKFKFEEEDRGNLDSYYVYYGYSNTDMDNDNLIMLIKFEYTISLSSDYMNFRRILEALNFKIYEKDYKNLRYVLISNSHYHYTLMQQMIMSKGVFAYNRIAKQFLQNYGYPDFKVNHLYILHSLDMDNPMDLEFRPEDKDAFDSIELLNVCNIHIDVNNTESVKYYIARYVLAEYETGVHSDGIEIIQNAIDNNPSRFTIVFNNNKYSFIDEEVINRLMQIPNLTIKEDNNYNGLYKDIDEVL